jgi:hypothetical protein
VVGKKSAPKLASQVYSVLGTQLLGMQFLRTTCGEDWDLITMDDGDGV